MDGGMGVEGQGRTMVAKMKMGEGGDGVWRMAGNSW